MPSLASKIAQGTVLTTLTSIGGFFVWTKHCEATPLDPSVEPLYKSPFYYKYNPYNNFTNADVISRRIPLHQLRPDLLEDAREGGSKLVEHFSGAIWSGWSKSSLEVFRASVQCCHHLCVAASLSLCLSLSSLRSGFHPDYGRTSWLVNAELTTSS